MNQDEVEESLSEAKNKVMEDAIAGQGAESTPCGTHSPTIKCAEGLCCGNGTLSDEEMLYYEYVYGKEGAKKMLGLRNTCEKEGKTPNQVLKPRDRGFLLNNAL